MTATPLNLSIAAVERDCGLSKDTLRIWERRYGFPAPMRDGQGERLYPLDQVEKLRLIRRLLDAGHRPGRIVSLPVSDLQLLSERMDSAPRQTPAPSAASVQTFSNLTREVAGFMQHIQEQDVAGLRRALQLSMARRGLLSFVADAVAPFLHAIGDAWLRGQIQIFQEHWASECLDGVLRRELGALPDPGPDARPRVLLTTFPGEPHGLGLLLAQCLFAVSGCPTVSLGVRTPVWDIGLAARAMQVDIVALSFSANAPQNQAIEGLANLYGTLPPSIQIWAGGACAALHRRDVAGVRTFRQLRDLPEAIEAWRADPGAALQPPPADARVPLDLGSFDHGQDD